MGRELHSPLARPAMVPPTLSGESVPDLLRGQVSRCFIHLAPVDPHPCGRVAWCTEAQYYDSSVTLALTGCRPSPSCSRSLASCFRCPVRRFPLLVGWSQRELCRAIVTHPETLSTGDHTVSCGLPLFHHDSDSNNSVFTTHDLAD